VQTDTTTHGSIRAYATYSLIAAQVVAWLLVRHYLLPGREWTELALRPGTPSEVALFVSPFIHLEPAHLGLNLLVLWLFGVNLERAIGSLRFLLFYLGAAWFASVMQWAVFTGFHVGVDGAPVEAAIGSSGAVVGIIGASLVRFPQSRLRIPLLRGATFPTTIIIVVWVTYSVVRALATTVAGVSEGVGHWAHFAGFIFGLGAAQIAGFHRLAREECLERVAEEAGARRNYPAAAQAWSALLALRPGDLVVRGELIAARLGMGDRPGARRLAREGLVDLVRLDRRQDARLTYATYTGALPDLDLPAGIRYRIGCWLAEAGESEAAVRVLLESVREDRSGAPAALYRAGQVAWERLSNDVQAREAWQRLLDQFPDSTWTDAAREGLRRLSAS
jgi:membrane associated rhomboid family serine protease